jgi:uncharacterized protein (DUF305 family)
MKKYFAGLACCLAAAGASAQDAQHHHGAASQSSAPVFTATTAKPFSALMEDAMAVMDQGMTQAPMNGQSEHDFMSMMIPHHQGAIDMARAVLLYSQDPEVRNLALGIIAEQQNEIRQMQAWLARHNSKQEDSHEHH